MAWEFETDPAFQQQLEWIRAFVEHDIEPLEHLLGSPYDVRNPANRRVLEDIAAVKAAMSSAISGPMQGFFRRITCPRCAPPRTNGTHGSSKSSRRRK